MVWGYKGCVCMTWGIKGGVYVYVYGMGVQGDIGL